MRHLTTALVLGAALSATLVLMAATPANVLASGSATFPSQTVGPLEMELTLIELPNGKVVGHGRQEAPDVGGYHEYDITSWAMLGDTLCMAGPITASVNTPFPVGATWVVCVEDNGNGGSGTPDRVATAAAPPGLTIQLILMFFPGFLPPPDSQFQPISAGDITIH